jgi:hypothetical protein
MACTVVYESNGKKEPVMSFAAKREAVNLVLYSMAGKRLYKKLGDRYKFALEFEIWDDNIQLVKLDEMTDWYKKGYQGQIDYVVQNPIIPNKYGDSYRRRNGPTARTMKMKAKDVHFQAFLAGWYHSFRDSEEMNAGVRVTNYKLF